MRINTGGRPLTRQEVKATGRKQRPNGRVIFEPGGLSAHSEMFTLDPGKAWIVTLTDAMQCSEVEVVVLRHAINHRSPCAALEVYSKDDMLDFIRTNGYQQMILGGRWMLSAEEPVLIMAVPGTYSFLADSVEALDTLSVVFEEIPLSVLHHLPDAYFAGMTYKNLDYDCELAVDCQAGGECAG